MSCWRYTHKIIRPKALFIKIQKMGLFYLISFRFVLLFYDFFTVKMALGDRGNQYI